MISVKRLNADWKLASTPGAYCIPVTRTACEYKSPVGCTQQLTCALQTVLPEVGIGTGPTASRGRARTGSRVASC